MSRPMSRPRLVLCVRCVRGRKVALLEATATRAVSKLSTNMANKAYNDRAQIWGSKWEQGKCTYNYTMAIKIQDLL